MDASSNTVVVAMSGGVDSSVTAALLLNQGYRVIGVTMQLWEPSLNEGAGDWGSCCSSAAVDDAAAVADKLSIPHYVLNCRDLFRRTVVGDFCRQYLAGRTPNPCVVCNRLIKFEALRQKAGCLGAGYLATGHYAVTGCDPLTGRHTLRRARDRHKDQTYFLYAMTQEQLAYTLMPLGGFTKAEVRRMAAQWHLPVAEKSESQEICFIPDDDYRRFLRENCAGQIKPGPFLDLEGRQIGCHEGIAYYTIGQRRGLGLGGGGQKIYVVRIDPERNAVIVGPVEALSKTSLTAADLNLVLAESITAPVRVEAQIRYKSAPAPATLTPLNEQRLQVDFDSPQQAVTPGQAVVFYRDEYLWGGGIIE